MWHYCRERDVYPLRLGTVLAITIETDSSPIVQRAAGRLFTEITADTTRSTPASSKRACTADLPEAVIPEIQSVQGEVRLYVHLQSKRQRPAARDMVTSFDGDTIGTHVVDVVSVEKLQSAPSETELRYFSSTQEDLARTLVGRVRAIHSSPIALKNMSAKYGEIIDYVELWLGARRRGP